MKKSWLLLLISCLFVLAACGNKQTEEKAAAETTSETKTVVAGTMVVADILDKLEIDSVVGVPTSTVKMPERYTKATEIGNAMNPDMEVVKSLNPDVFISVTTLEYDLKPAVKNINVNGEFIDLQGVKQMQDSILA